MALAKLLKKEILLENYGKKTVKAVYEAGKNKIDWVYMDCPKSAIIVPITKENKVVLVRQYRYNLEKFVYEFPAGKSEGNELPEETAERELLEETGYEMGKCINLGSYYVLPSETNKYETIFLVLDAYKKEEAKLDNDIEKYFDLSTHLVDFNELSASKKVNGIELDGMEHLFALQKVSEYLSH